MADILLEHTVDGGAFRVSNGDLAIDNGLSTAVYLSLFGGNSEDDGTEATSGQQYWGNRLETEKASMLRGELQAMLNASPITSASIQRIEQAAARDLTWMVDAGLAQAIATEVTIPAVDTIALEVRIQVGENVVVLGYEVNRAP